MKSQNTSYYQFRYLAYCQANNKSPKEMLRHDKTRFPGGCMSGFIRWIIERISTWKKEVGFNRTLPMTPKDQEQFNQWLMNNLVDTVS